MEQNGFTAQEVLRDIVLDCLITIELHQKNWCTYGDSPYIYGCNTSQIELSLEMLGIVKKGYFGTEQLFKLERTDDKADLQVLTPIGYQTITIVDLSEMFGYDYETKIKCKYYQKGLKL